MTRWKSDTTECTVRVSRGRNRGGTPDRTCRVPRPVAEALGDPDSLKFVIVNGQVVVEAGSP